MTLATLAEALWISLVLMVWVALIYYAWSRGDRNREDDDE